DFPIQIIEAGEGAPGVAAVHKIIGASQAEISQAIVGVAKRGIAEHVAVGIELDAGVGEQRVDSKIVPIQAGVEDVVVGFVVGLAKRGIAEHVAVGIELAAGMGEQRVDSKIVPIPAGVEDVVVGFVVGLIVGFAVAQGGVAVAIGETGDQGVTDAGVDAHREM